jgi:hypothetical protein
MVSCIAAVVDDSIITRLDVEIVEAFGLAGATAGSSATTGSSATADKPVVEDAFARRKALLETMIDRRIVLDQVRGPETAPADLLDGEWRSLAERIGAAGVSERLARLGVASAEVRSALGEKIRFERAIDERFGRSVAVSLKDIEALYEESYVPARRRAGEPVRPLVEVLDALEVQVRRAKIEARASQWIETLRDQAEVEIREDCLK